MSSNAQQNCYKPVNIGQYNLNFIAEKKVALKDVGNYLTENPDNPYQDPFREELILSMNAWAVDEDGSPSRNFINDPYFVLNTERTLDHDVFRFSDDTVNVIFFFRYGSSRWHHFNVLLENLLLPRNELVDYMLNMKYYDDLYKAKYKGLKHGSTISEVERVLGNDYYEYLGQSLQLQNIYFENCDREFCIQDGIVKYISTGKPGWMDSDLVEKHK